jgi:hypothetical protein
MGPEKYDETTAAMIALLKYGSGRFGYFELLPWKRQDVRCDLSQRA